MCIVRGDSGDHVRDLQEALEALGHALPRYGVDGEAGSETFNAVEEFFWSRGQEFDPDSDLIPTDEVALIIGSVEDRPPVPSRPAWPGPWLQDNRLEDTSKQRGRRDWSEVTGITLHQTACCFLSDLDPSDEKVSKALKRVKKIKAHFVVLRCGAATFNAPLDRVMAHGHAFNKSDVGIEVDGYYAGVHGDDSTFWRPKSRPNRKPMEGSEKQIKAVRDVIRYVVEEVAAQGGEVRYIHAHRQTHRGKPSDPGEVIWTTIGLWAQEQFGLSDGGDGYYVPHHRDRGPGGLSSKAGPGRPIPREWDMRRTWAYKKRP
jgi:hypothetical protein